MPPTPDFAALNPGYLLASAIVETRGVGIR